MSEDASPKYPKRVLNIVKACENGQTLHYCNVTLRGGNSEPQYWFEPSGKSAPPKSSRQAIDAGLVVPMGDGLFGGLSSQSFRAA